MGLQCRTMQASVFSGVWRVSKGQVRTVSGSSQACFPWVGGTMSVGTYSGLWLILFLQGEGGLLLCLQ